MITIWLDWDELASFFGPVKTTISIQQVRQSVRIVLFIRVYYTQLQAPHRECCAVCWNRKAGYNDSQRPPAWKFLEHPSPGRPFWPRVEIVSVRSTRTLACRDGREEIKEGLRSPFRLFSFRNQQRRWLFSSISRWLACHSLCLP